MRYAIDLAPLGPLADPHALVRLAVAAERADWDGVSTWDVLGTVMGAAAADPWVALTAIASRTERVALLASVIVLPRRRPQLVAQAAATLDAWSSGRLVLGIGAGGDPMDFTAFGESFDRHERIPRLDRDAEAIDVWLRGEGDVVVGPRPAQQPRPPMWVGGMRPGARRRAARWDGWIAVATSEDGQSMALSPDDFEGMVQDVRAERAALGRADEPLDIGVFGRTEPGEEQVIADFETTGATWWLESLSPLRGSETELLARIEAGPPSR
jgi:alkanesulfonate monooxygenase SsuD/methylene tetrahydromethanopterin reductase-like flavin-dependent oxidoreductase (luciferase family)